jgi:hypothetical protein
MKFYLSLARRKNSQLDQKHVEIFHVGENEKNRKRFFGKGREGKNSNNAVQLVRLRNLWPRLKYP